MAAGRRLRVLHLASFTGNVGDNAMHDGANRTRAEDIPVGLDTTAVEIRDFIHWRVRRFDDSFIDEANRHDLVIIGGDSVFSPWLTETATGTYFDVAPDWFDRIRVPVVFYGLGCDSARGVTDAAARGMADFLGALRQRDDRLVAFRNDGSRDVVAAAAGGAAVAGSAVIPDGGLFAVPRASQPPALDPGFRWVAVNLAGDMPEVRFAGIDGGADGYWSAVVDAIDRVLRAEPDVGVVLVPHIPSDVPVVATVLGRLDDRLRRTRVAIGPYGQGPAHWGASFDLYRQAATVLAMRFHATLVPLGLGRPVIGIDTHPKVGGVLRQLGLDDRILRPAGTGDADAIADRVLGDLRHPDAGLAARTAAAVRRERMALKAFHQQMADLIDRYC